jgi:hypothetical protein
MGGNLALKPHSAVNTAVILQKGIDALLHSPKGRRGSSIVQVYIHFLAPIQQRNQRIQTHEKAGIVGHKFFLKNLQGNQTGCIRYL